MTEITRRSFNLLAGASLAALSTPLFAPSVLGQAKPRLVVVGGGPAGATVARYVAKDSAGAIDVTLIEPLKNFTTCFFSNLYVGGFRDLKSLRHNYDKVRKGGVNVVPVMASSIDRDKKHLPAVLRAAAEHPGAALVEILQNCPVFNDGAFEPYTDRTSAAETLVKLEHGEPLRFGDESTHGIARDASGTLEVVDRTEGLLVHDAHRDDPSLAFGLSRC